MDILLERNHMEIIFWINTINLSGLHMKLIRSIRNISTDGVKTFFSYALLYFLLCYLDYYNYP